MKICGIYKITSPTKKIYIGQSVNIIKRISYYKCLNCKSQVRLYNSLKKYGWEKHIFEMLCQCDKSELNNLEKYYIKLYQCFNTEHGLNLRNGGGRGSCSEEIKKKISNALKGKRHSEETKKRMSESHKKIGPVSKETRKKIAKKNKGQKRTKEVRIKMGLSHKGIGVGIKNLQYIKDNIKFKTQTQIARELNIDQSTVSKLLTNNKNHVDKNMEMA